MQVKIGPAVYSTSSISWTASRAESCEANTFAYHVKTKKQHPIFYSDIRLKCHDEPELIGNTTPGGPCSTFALGYQAEYVVGEGVSALHIECEHNEWVTAFSHDPVCFEPVVWGQRFKCDSGWALCGIEVDRHCKLYFNIFLFHSLHLTK